MKKFVVLNKSGNLATSSEGAVHDSIGLAMMAVNYLRNDLDLNDEKWTIAEAELTIGKTVREYPADEQ